MALALRTALVLRAPKTGERLDDCEDFAQVAIPYGDGITRIAVCDGATESAFAKEWARILTQNFVRRPLSIPSMDGPSFSKWLEPCSNQWDGIVPWERIPWHGRAKTRAGAFATLLGMTIGQIRDNPGMYSWNAIAIGDTCLFIVRDQTLLISFPLGNSNEFNNSPILVSSNQDSNVGIWPRVQRQWGKCQPGDWIIVASDALARWILEAVESGGNPWETLAPLNSRTWEGWVQCRRDERVMHNDDTTLISLTV